MSHYIHKADLWSDMTRGFSVSGFGPLQEYIPVHIMLDFVGCIMLINRLKHLTQKVKNASFVIPVIAIACVAQLSTTTSS